MNIYPSFDHRINRFLKEQPESNSVIIINKLKASYPHLNTFYDIYDSFYSKLKVTFGNFPIYVGQSEKAYSHIPIIKYFEGNLLNESARIEKLYDDNSKITFDKCYEYLAKALTYKLIELESIDNLLI